jgi:radical SAM protein with 4Fe4S-binding SPASM domain
MDYKKIFFSKSFCAAPWNNAYIDTEGKVYTCSIGKQLIGNVTDSSLNDILKNSKNLEDIKTQMLNEVRPTQCQTCWDLEDTGTSYSLRKHYNKTFVSEKSIHEYQSPTSTKIRGLDLRLKNTCQNACVYCGPILSSRLAQELSIKNSTLTDKQASTVEEEIYQYLSDLDEIYLAGGEPLIIKGNEKLLKILLEVNPNCKVRVNSNIKNLNTPVYNLSKMFKNIQYTVSVDSINEIFEYIRYPQKWQSFVKNYYQIQQEISVHNVNMVLTSLNSLEIYDAVEWLLDQGTHENSFIITHAHTPEWMNVNNLPNGILEACQLKAEEYMKSCNKNFFLYSAMEGIVNFIDYSYKKDFASIFYNLKEIDKRRNLNSKQVFSKLYSLL